MTALFEASTQGNLGVVRALLDAPDIDVNAANEDGWTPLICAAGLGHLEVVRALLNRSDADANAREEIQ